MSGDLTADYKSWLQNLKEKIRQVQIKASVAVNQELLTFYWELGADIVEKQKDSSWGDGFLRQLSQDLMKDFPEIKGFSKRNLEQIRRWYRFWNDCETIAKQPATQNKRQIITQLIQIPWWHNVIIVSKCSSIKQALFYVENTVQFGWSRSVLTHQIESDLYNRQGKALSNFDKTLPAPQSDLAKEVLKDPYVFDFLTLTSEYNERELENNLILHITKFLIELGAGFAYLGKQIPLKVGEREFFVDLLFYHVKLHCYVVIELKTGEFEPEHAGKLNFYIKAVDEQFRQKGDEPTIGILLCKTRDRLVAEYALSDIHKPMGVSEYQFTQSLPEKFKSSLPSIEEIEEEFSKDNC